MVFNKKFRRKSILPPHFTHPLHDPTVRFLEKIYLKTYFARLQKLETFFYEFIIHYESTK